MARILIANEVGSGYFHIATLLSIFDALDARGHKSILSAPRLDGADAMLRGRQVPVVVSPYLETENHYTLTGRHAASFSDVIGYYGYGDFDRLLLLVSVWETMIKELDIDLVIGEYCPSLCLAAMGRVPMILVGEDFSFPPASADAFPPVNDLEPAYPIDFLMDNVARVQRARDQRVPNTLTEIFRVAGRFVCVYPEVDVFGDLRDDPVVGPIDVRLSPMPPAPEPRIFLYVHRNSARGRSVLQMVANSKIPTEAHVFDAEPAFYSQFDGSAIKFHLEPQPLAEILQRTSLVVHHCSTGMANHTAAAGRGQILAVEHIGHYAHARVLERLGVGRRIAKVANNPKIEEGTEIIRAAATNGSFDEKAQALAAQIEASGPWDPIGHIVKRCEEILRAPGDFVH
jgi:rhamnosyltransferase subunit B